MEAQTELWLSVAGQLYRREKLEEFVQAKGVYATEMWQHLQPTALQFIQVVTGQAQSPASVAVCINRLLKSPLNTLPDAIRQQLATLIANTFYLGMGTQMYIFNCPARAKCKHTDITKFVKEWEVMAMGADQILEGHGDANAAFVKNIGERHFDVEVRPFLEKKLGLGGFMGAIRMGKIESFFRNLYYAGIALVMRCEIEAQQMG